MTLHPGQSNMDINSEEREEAERHDTLYEQERDVEKLRLKPEDWQKFDSISEPLNAYYGSMARLGDIRGLRVLDAGCGDGWLSTILAKRGALVDGFDISAEGIRTAELRTALNGVKDQCRFVAASFYKLPYEDRRFDAVIGQAILHHLRQKDLVAKELFRVMKPGARAVFVEPFGNSVTLERLRNLVPVPSAAPEDPTEWKRQIRYSDLRSFTDEFDVVREEFHLFSRLDRVIKVKSLVNALARFDRRLLKSLPFLRPYARSIVIELRRRAD